MRVERLFVRYGENMSRVGKLPIKIPAEVKIDLEENVIIVSGPKGIMRVRVPIQVRVDGGMVKVAPTPGNLAGLTRTLVANAIAGVTIGWVKTLELSGTGYRAQTSGKQLTLALGFSHPVVIEAPEGIAFEVKENKIMISGVDRGLVGEMAAKLRGLRPADPYKAKGFKYEGEIIVKKAGKAAKAGATTTK